MKIVVIATLDTKGEEAAFIRDEIIHKGFTPLVLDPGSTGIPMIKADISREEIALAGGESLPALLARNDKAYVQQAMINGLINVVSKLYSQGQLDGIISVGGGQGTAIATAAMRVLPVGIPKVMVSTVASGKTTFGPYVGTKDITMIHSVADIAGLNFITRKIIAQATAAVMAMADVKIGEHEKRELVAMTQAGVTTPGVMEIKRLLEEKNFEVVIFHCNGIGGQAMEELIREGVIQGVIDYSPHEIIDLLCNGLMPALPGRMTAAGEMGIPQIIGPGCADMRLHTWDSIPPELKDRPYVRHTPTHTHFRTTYEEMSAVAHYISEHVNAGHGPRAVIAPLQGYSMMNRAGMPLYDAAANRGYVDTLKKELNADVRLVEIDAHINDPACAQATVDLFMQLRASKIN
ncbi:MAG: Tm-1-like ATP-binding domain-containing protein [Anaerolineae bacterium]|nr:Tm-1-like ATP-binding domain-containing protein [Anaerolineae bacterium]